MGLQLLSGESADRSPTSSLPDTPGEPGLSGIGRLTGLLPDVVLCGI